MASDSRFAEPAPLLAWRSCPRGAVLASPADVGKSDQKNLHLGFDCRVQYQRGQCAIHLDTPNNNLNGSLGFIARELANVRDNGLSKEEFDALLAQKTIS